MSRALRGLPAAALIALSLPSSAFAIEAAVSPFAAVGVDGEVAFNVTSAFSSELEFRVEYDWVEQLDSPPTGMSAKCLSSTSCLKTAGKAAGKNHFIGGNVSAVGDMLEVEVVLFDVDKGTLVRRKTFNTTEAGLMSDSSSFVNELLTGASHEADVAAATVADSSEFLDGGDDWDFDDGYEVSSTIPLPSSGGKSLDDFEDPLEYEAELARERAAEEEARRQEEEARLRREEEARLAAARAAEQERLRQEEEERLRREEEARLAAARAAAEEEERRRRDEEAAAAAAAAAAAMSFDDDEMDLDSISFGSAADEITVDDISFGSSASSIIIEEEDDPYVADSRSGYEEVDLDDWSDFEDEESDWDEDDYGRTRGGYLDLDEEPEQEESTSRRSSSSSDRSSRSNDRSSRSSNSSSISSANDEGLGFQIAARGGVSRYQSFGFITYGAEIGIPVADKVAVRVGLEGFSTEREIPPALRTDANEETRWNTILPFNGGVAFYPITSGTFRPYLGGDITLTPYTPEFDMSPGVRGRAGADLMFSDNFGLNANLALGFWYGKEFAQIQEGLSNSGLVPQASAGTVIMF